MGPRRVGKTYLITEYLKNTNKKYIKFDGSDYNTSELFSDNNLSKIKNVIEKYDIVFIDEAQEVKNIGVSLKLINDHMPEISVIATGSSSFELNNQVREPLVGRSTTRFLYPFSINELIQNQEIQFNEIKNSVLIYGSYPDCYLAGSEVEKKEYLKDLVNNLLLKDILTFQEVKGSQIIMKLLILLSYQIGKEVSINELATNLGISKNTVDRYLDLLEKSYIIFRMNGYNNNHRKQISKKPRYFFYDLGIRNALINNFNSIEIRNDIGELWENYVIVERMKTREYKRLYANQYFWRSYEKKEIDLIEERDGNLFAYEIKYSDEKAAKTKVPTDWIKSYPDSSFQVISQSNFFDFINK